MNINIDKITLNINGKKLELTLQQCEELKKIIDKIVEKKPEWTITSTWPKDGIINVPFVPNDYPLPPPVTNWCGTDGTSAKSNLTYTIN